MAGCPPPPPSPTSPPSARRNLIQVTSQTLIYSEQPGPPVRSRGRSRSRSPGSPRPRSVPLQSGQRITPPLGSRRQQTGGSRPVCQVSATPRPQNVRSAGRRQQSPPRNLNESYYSEPSRTSGGTYTIDQPSGGTYTLDNSGATYTIDPGEGNISGGTYTVDPCLNETYTIDQHSGRTYSLDRSGGTYSIDQPSRRTYSLDGSGGTYNIDQPSRRTYSLDRSGGTYTIDQPSRRTYSLDRSGGTYTIDDPSRRTYSLDGSGRTYTIDEPSRRTYSLDRSGGTYTLDSFPSGATFNTDPCSADLEGTYTMDSFPSGATFNTDPGSADLEGTYSLHQFPSRATYDTDPGSVNVDETYTMYQFPSGATYDTCPSSLDETDLTACFACPVAASSPRTSFETFQYPSHGESQAVSSPRGGQGPREVSWCPSPERSRSPGESSFGSDPFSPPSSSFGRRFDDLPQESDEDLDTSQESGMPSDVSRVEFSIPSSPHEFTRPPRGWGDLDQSGEIPSCPEPREDGEPYGFDFLGSPVGGQESPREVSKCPSPERSRAPGQSSAYSGDPFGPSSSNLRRRYDDLSQIPEEMESPSRCPTAQRSPQSSKRMERGGSPRRVQSSETTGVYRDPCVQRPDSAPHDFVSSPRGGQGPSSPREVSWCPSPERSRSPGQSSFGSDPFSPPSSSFGRRFDDMPQESEEDMDTSQESAMPSDVSRVNFSIPSSPHEFTRPPERWGDLDQSGEIPWCETPEYEKYQWRKMERGGCPRRTQSTETPAVYRGPYDENKFPWRRQSGRSYRNFMCAPQGGQGSREVSPERAPYTYAFLGSPVGGQGPREVSRCPSPQQSRSPGQLRRAQAQRFSPPSSSGSPSPQYQQTTSKTGRGGCPRRAQSAETPATRRDACAEGQDLEMSPETLRQFHKKLKSLEKRVSSVERSLTRSRSSTDALRQRVVQSQDVVNRGINRLKTFLQEKRHTC